MDEVQKQTFREAILMIDQMVRFLWDQVQMGEARDRGRTWSAWQRLMFAAEELALLGPELLPELRDQVRHL